MICFGVVNAICSVLFGSLMKYIGRFSIIVFGTVVHMGIFSYLLFWRPHPDHPLVFFVISGLWGVGGFYSIYSDMNDSFMLFKFIFRCRVADSNQRIVWNAFQTQQGGSIFKLPTVGVARLRHRLRIFYCTLRANEALLGNERSRVRRILLHHCRDQTASKGKILLSFQTNPFTFENFIAGAKAESVRT